MLQDRSVPCGTTASNKLNAVVVTRLLKVLWLLEMFLRVTDKVVPIDNST
jgi:hypothetical protein